MLHAANFPAAPFRSPTADLSASPTFMAARATVARQWPTMLTVVLTAFAVATIYVLTAQPKYTATAELYVDTHKVQLLQPQQTLGVDAPIDSSLIDSQVEILKSEDIARAVRHRQVARGNRQAGARQPGRTIQSNQPGAGDLA